MLFAFVLVRRATAGGRTRENVYAILVLGFLGWWAFCDAFFYPAATQEAAWVWHRLSAIGWGGFVAASAAYFLTLAGAHKYFNTAYKEALYWAAPAAFVLRNVLAQPTSLARELVQSKSGLGWTIVPNLGSGMLWLYVAYIAVYLGGALGFLLYGMRKKEKTDHEKKLAVGFALVNLLAVAAGVLTLLVLPAANFALPSFASGATLIFLAGYWGALREYDLLHVELALNHGSVFETCLDALLITDENFHIQYANAEAKGLLGLTAAEQPDFIARLSDASAEEVRGFARSGEKQARSLSLALRKDATPLLCSVSRASMGRSHLTVYIFSLYDVTSLKQAQDKLQYLAHYDELTGLPNRRCFEGTMQRWAQEYKAAGKDFWLLFLDFNNFKYINDNCGHRRGDEVLRCAALAIAKELPKEDAIARIGGDEFVVLHSAATAISAQELADKLQAAVRKTDGEILPPDYHMGVSVGACAYSDAQDLRILMKKADERMYANKRCTCPAGARSARD